MTDGIDDSGAQIPSADAEDPVLLAVEQRLRAERPLPRAAFRSELRGRLLSRPRSWAGGGVRRLVAAYATSGLALLAVAAIGVAGAGPLAAG